MPAHHAGKKRLGGNRGASGFPRAVTPPLASLRSVLVGLARLPLLQLLLGLVLADAVRVLDLANQLVAITGDPVQVVVGELAPLLLHFALHLLPVAFDAVPVHCVSFRGGAGNAFVIPAHAVARCRRMPMVEVARTTTRGPRRRRAAPPGGRRSPEPCCSRDAPRPRCSAPRRTPRRRAPAGPCARRAACDRGNSSRGAPR